VIRRALVLAMVALASPAHGNPADLYGLGARVPAMGGAGTATTADTAAGYYNPAAIGLFENIRIDLGYQYARPELELNDRDVGVDSSRGIATGIAVPGTIGRAVKMALAGTFFLPDRYFVRTRALAGSQPRFQLYDNRPQRFILAANLGFSFLEDRLAVGGGLTYMSGTNGTINLQGRVGFPNAEDSELVQGIDMDVETVPYPQAGVLFKATDRITIGLSYRGAFELKLSQVLDVRGSVGSADQEQIVEDAFITVTSLAKDHYVPLQITAGIAAQVTSDLLVAFDLGYHAWSRFHNPSTIVRIDLDVGQFNDDINIEDAPAFPDPRFKDILVPRLGVEWRALSRTAFDLDVRGGYSYERSPAPQQTSDTNFVDNDKHTVSLGTGATFRGLTEIVPLPFSLDAFASFTVLPERTHRKESPVDPVGDYKSDGTVVQVGIGSSWRF